MDRRLLHFYNTELQHIRQMAGEFAREYPKIAGRLALDKDGKEACPDPFVERLLEGFAYLAARVHVKLEAEFPRFTQCLLETVYPQYLCPMPSMAVIRFAPDLNDKSLADGFLIERGTSMRTSVTQNEHTACVYRTAHPLKLWPIELTEAAYHDRRLATLDLPTEANASAAITLGLRATASLNFCDIKLDRLTFFLRGTDSLPVTVLEYLMTHTIGVWARDPDSEEPKWIRLISGALSPVGMVDTEALLPHSPTTFEGYRLLMEYFSFPQRFLFFRLDGFEGSMHHFKGPSMEIAITLDKADPEFFQRINKSLFDLYCTPAINLFEKRADRIRLSDRFSEFHVVVDRTRPTDFEIFSIESVRGYGIRAGEEQDFLPFYLARDADSDSTAFFTINRVDRVLTEHEKKFGRLTAYSGSEVFISLVDSAAAPYSADLEQLGVTALVTNRHLPIRINRGDGGADFLVEFNGPVLAARCLAGPTIPRPSFALGETAWRLISHLSLNYFSITDTSEADGASSLRELLRLYVDPADRSMLKQIDGIRSVVSTPILRRVKGGGMMALARGVEIKVIFDEEAFAGFGVFVLGMVLEQFFARHVTINSFTETVIASKQRGDIIRWPARSGRRHVL